MALVVEEKYQVRRLINMGKERGYLLSIFERYGIDVYEDVSIAKPAPTAAGAACLRLSSIASVA